MNWKNITYLIYILLKRNKINQPIFIRKLKAYKLTVLSLNENKISKYRLTNDVNIYLLMKYGDIL